jgi:hypothetical protein
MERKIMSKNFLTGNLEQNIFYRNKRLPPAQFVQSWVPVNISANGGQIGMQFADFWRIYLLKPLA